MRKLRRKISGGFRSAQRVRACATLRSGLSIALQQGLHRIKALRPGPDALLAGLPG